MAKIEKLIDVGAPPEEIFEAFGDSANIARWMPAVREVQLVEGNRSRWILDANRNTSADGQGEVTAEIVERRSPEQIMWRVTRGDEAVEIATRFILTRSGGTLLHCTVADAGTGATADSGLLLSEVLGGSDLPAAERNLEASLARFRETILSGADDDTVTNERPSHITDEDRQKFAAALAAGSVAPAAIEEAKSTVIPGSTPLTLSDDLQDDIDETLVTASPRVTGSLPAQPPTPQPTREQSSRGQQVTTPKRENTGRQTFSPVPPRSSARGAQAPHRSSFVTIGLAALALLVALSLVWMLSGNRDRSDATASNGGNATSSAGTENNLQADANAQPAADAAGQNAAQLPGYTTPSPTTAPTIATSRSARNNPDPKVGEVRRQLDEWVAATNNANLRGQINFYAPVVERFYLRRNYRRSSVEREKERLMSRGRLVDVAIEDPEITLSRDGRTATMRFRKSYRVEGTQRRSAVLQELKWRLIDGEWLIVSERDLRVLS